MFTGIITNLGRIEKKDSISGRVRLSIRFQKREKRPVYAGESIAVDGVCLTVVKSAKRVFRVDAVTETLSGTTLGTVSKGQYVNLERSLRYGDELGGHFVTGHVDGIGEIVKIDKRPKNWLFTIAAPKKLMQMIAVKGSVTVDGVSLTVQALRGNQFQVTVIPYTLKETALGKRRMGQTVNLEIDLIARYLKRLSRALTKPHTKSKISLKSLLRQGF
ncbi:MAG: riboflavin synthase subunit alpha [Omnitrophica bacterium GWA2_52_8]|nr:MAG: riboflavin synthase subunit alpha [Omnitrophica bacterium GWA2_52_8]